MKKALFYQRGTQGGATFLRTLMEHDNEDTVDLLNVADNPYFSKCHFFTATVRVDSDDIRYRVFYSPFDKNEVLIFHKGYEFKFSTI